MATVLLALLAGPAVAQSPALRNTSASNITVVLDDDYPPYVFRDEQGQFKGILIDLWALWQAHTGVSVRLLPMKWSAALEMMQAGRADVIDTLFKSPQREQLYDYLAPYADIDVPIFFHNSVSGIVNAESLKGFVVGVKDGDLCTQRLSERGVTEFKRYPSYSAVISAAREGSVRVFCVDQPPGVYLLHEMGMTQDYRRTLALYTGQFHRAVRKGDQAMLDLVARGFASITPEESQRVQEAWYGSNVNPARPPAWRRWVMYIALAGTGIILVLTLWNLMLRRRVNDKTLALTTAMAELQQARQQSDEALNRLTRIADSLPGMVYQYQLRPDGSSCFPYASEAIRNIYRLNPEDVKNDASAVFATGHPDDVAGAVASIQESARTLKPWSHEFRVQFSDGSVHWRRGDALPQRLVDGSVLWHGFVTDVTERKQAEEKLLQLSNAVHQAPVAIVITNPAGQIDYVNPFFTDVTGYTLNEVRGANPRILKSGQTAPSVYIQMWATLLRGQVWRGELRNRKKNGDLFDESAVISPVINAHGKIIHFVAIKIDITERKRSEQLLQSSLMEKTALLHEVHHRVKNNLQVITSLLRLESGRSTLAQTQAVLKDMQGRIHAMASLHESLYRTGVFSSVDLCAYLKQLATQAFRSQTGSGSAVQLVLELAPATASVDQATPCGLLVNELLSNALKHAFVDGRNGTVTVQLQPQPQAPPWCLAVQDNGVGLPTDFEQRRTRSLGLQLASDLAQQLGGTLQCEAAIGGGTRLSVRFALATPTPPVAA